MLIITHKSMLEKDQNNSLYKATEHKRVVELETRDKNL